MGLTPIPDDPYSIFGSPQTRSTLWDAKNNRSTVFARELDQLKAAGYKQQGDYMLPPSN